MYDICIDVRRIVLAKALQATVLHRISMDQVHGFCAHQYTGTKGTGDMLHMSVILRNNELRTTEQCWSRVYSRIPIKWMKRLWLASKWYPNHLTVNKMPFTNKNKNKTKQRRLQRIICNKRHVSIFLSWDSTLNYIITQIDSTSKKNSLSSFCLQQLPVWPQAR